MRPSVPLLLASANTDSASLTNSAVATSILHGSGKPTLNGGALDVGSKIKIRLTGSMGVGASGAGNFTFDVRYGGNVITSLGAMSLRTSSSSTTSFQVDFDLTCRNNSTGGNFMGSATFVGPQSLGSTLTSTILSPVILPLAGPIVGSNVDLTASGALDVFGTWSVATTGNIILVNTSEILLIN